MDKEIELLKLKIQMLEKEIELLKLKQQQKQDMWGSYPYRTQTVPCVKAIPMPPYMETITQPHSFTISNALGTIVTGTTN